MPVNILSWNKYLTTYILSAQRQFSSRSTRAAGTKKSSKQNSVVTHLCKKLSKAAAFTAFWRHVVVPETFWQHVLRLFVQIHHNRGYRWVIFVYCAFVSTSPFVSFSGLNNVHIVMDVNLFYWLFFFTPTFMYFFLIFCTKKQVLASHVYYYSLPTRDFNLFMIWPSE